VNHAFPLHTGQSIACLLYKKILFSLQKFKSSNNYLSGMYNKHPHPSTRTCSRPLNHASFLPRIQFHWTNCVTRRSVGISFDVQLPLTCHGLIRFLIYVINNLIKMWHLMHECLLINQFIYLFIYLFLELYIHIWQHPVLESCQGSYFKATFLHRVNTSRAVVRLVNIFNSLTYN
jgi:hypothetical protein